MIYKIITATPPPETAIISGKKTLVRFNKSSKEVRLVIVASGEISFVVVSKAVSPLKEVSIDEEVSLDAEVSLVLDEEVYWPLLFVEAEVELVEEEVLVVPVELAVVEEVLFPEPVLLVETEVPVSVLLVEEAVSVLFVEEAVPLVEVPLVDVSVPVPVLLVELLVPCPKQHCEKMIIQSKRNPKQCCESSILKESRGAINSEQKQMGKRSRLDGMTPSTDSSNVTQLSHSWKKKMTTMKKRKLHLIASRTNQVLHKWQLRA